MKVIGLMSGTSLDGCDVALVEIEKDNYKLIDYLLYPYSDEFKEKIKRNLSDDTAKLSEICSLNFELPHVFKKAVDSLLEKNNLSYKDIELIASHGQTIWHCPHGGKNQVPSTLQIGSGQVLSTLTQVKVVSNFRLSDVALGGEGAPLVPEFEYLYFKDDQKNVVLQNIGGMGNLTYIPKKASEDDIIAFDTGPGNVMIDHFMKKYYNKDYDENGEIALKGSIILPIFNELIKDSFFEQMPPKSTGREKYSFEALELLADKYSFDMYAKEDIITTITEITVYSISLNYRKFLKGIDKIVISGGGVHNQYIIKRLKEEFPGIVYSLDECGLNSDAKEAFAFAVLGYLTLNGKHGNVTKATGARKKVVLGELSYNLEID
ncbi:MAG: anhydro-N-acetylmuramic acid kinase [Coprobacillus sp.]|nr:anhydro-N-acetylmuramic acid kinase [Coprobacillus sp.]OLA09638.1 MAG: anhydro-N-acetylmuramic acid kinase [Coprobacillus sp. 28_7]